jgi:hydrogenase nickel incorporation protein HypA/HybF
MASWTPGRRTRPRTEEAPLHELSIATEIYQLCRAQLDARGPGRLEEVKVAVGELAGVEPDLLAFAWEALTTGGPDAGSRLQVEWRPARQVCEHCGDVRERSDSFWLQLCPHCGRPLAVEGGRELDVLEFSFTPDEAEEDAAS